MPVYEGFALPHAVKRIDVAGILFMYHNNRHNYNRHNYNRHNNRRNYTD
jgi:hypothetical protein